MKRRRWRKEDTSQQTHTDTHTLLYTLNQPAVLDRRIILTDTRVAASMRMICARSSLSLSLLLLLLKLLLLLLGELLGILIFWLNGEKKGRGKHKPINIYRKGFFCAHHIEIQGLVDVKPSASIAPRGLACSTDLLRGDCAKGGICEWCDEIT